MADAGGGVKLPGVGHVSKRWLGIVAIASAASIGYFLYRRKQNAAAAAASPAAAASTDTTGQIDPLTGDIAGSAQDQLDLASLQSGGYGSGMYGAGSPLGNYGGYLAASPAGSAIPGAGGFTTNGEWAQQAEADLQNPPGLSSALGKYLTARPLTAADQDLTDQAIAEEGYPPVSGPGGYPPAMHTTPTGGGSGGGSGGGGGGNVPGTVTGLKVTALWSTGADIHWTATPGATGYDVAVDGHPAVNIGNTTYHGIGGLKPKTRHTVMVSAKPSASGHASISFTTQ